jgi:hypothetical protein
MCLAAALPEPAFGQQANCQVPPFRGMTQPGGASATMLVVNNGEACRFRFWMTTDRQPFETATVATPPSNGTATATTSGAAYTPRAGFAGTDQFTVTATGRFSGQIVVRVTVSPP